jgi:hypothetical protein
LTQKKNVENVWKNLSQAAKKLTNNKTIISTIFIRQICPQL